MSVTVTNMYLVTVFIKKSWVKKFIIANLYSSRIVSPKCLIICFTNGEPIPEGRSPIYTTSMRRICVCASGFNPETKVQFSAFKFELFARVVLIVITGLDTTTSRIYGRLLHKAIKKFCHTFSN